MSIEPALVSIIMPAKDVDKYIGVAVQSVIDQTYKNWELIIIENGSTDETPTIISKFCDNRIRVVRSQKIGLSHARNRGLKIASGSFICFLDADDMLPPRSIESRAEYFEKNPDVTFLDGTVLTYNYRLEKVLRVWNPVFRGNPKSEIVKLVPGCFCGITWMIRKLPDMNLSFDESWTHLEDRIFFISIAQYGSYDFVDEQIYFIRRRSGSLMANHDALESAYRRLMDFVNQNNFLTIAQQVDERKYFHRMFFKTYLKNFRIARALSHLKNMF